MYLIESVPNISEGRRPEIVRALVGAVRSTAGVHVLDFSSDVSHNRSVITLAGGRTAVKAAILSLFSAALQLIDMRAHAGVHPRLGAVDVVPFIPLEGATMAECVSLADEVGRAVADRFGVPVFLYEAAARSDARRHLENIRRGGFEGLPAKLATPEWAPDFGPGVPHPTAGATVIGARMPLIAYNINLNTDRLEVARRIAATVRQSSGGLPHVKAIGVMLSHRNLAQVSMNLTNYQETPLHEVFDLVSREAARHGVAVLESEIIGLVPSAALADAARHYLKIAGFSPDRILENRLRASE